MQYAAYRKDMERVSYGIVCFYRIWIWPDAILNVHCNPIVEHYLGELKLISQEYIELAYFAAL